MNDDAQSISSSHSTSSTAKAKLECHYCNKDFQICGMFKHIRTKHTTEFYDNVRSKWLEEAEKGEPLRVWWETKNDIGEEITREIYVCLATDKSFMTYARARSHFKKSPAALKLHCKQINDLKRDIKKATEKKLKEKEKDPRLVMMKEAQMNNDPDLARALWSNILFDKKICDYCVGEAKRFRSTLETEEPMIWKRSNRSTYTITFDEWIAKYESAVTIMNALLAEKCLDYGRLSGVYIFFWNFWGVQVPENIPFISSKLSYTNDDSITRGRVDMGDVFEYDYRNGKADSELKKMIADMPKVEF
jgi:hypothetical protein